MIKHRGNMKQYEESDLSEIARFSSPFLTNYSGKKILISGATGFVGSWLTAFFDYANRNFSTNFQVTCLARVIPKEFRVFYPDFNFLEGDVSNHGFTSGFRSDCIINAATPSVPKRGGEDPSQILKASIDGTENLLGLSSENGETLFINLSSGIVTKRVTDELLDLSLPKDAYLHGKRVSEELVNRAIKDGKVKGRNARLYAFAGPGISLTDHFAVGNFVNDALSGRPIEISGNPLTVRSYLYPTDLIINLLKLSDGNEQEVSEIGSASRVTMQEIATLINSVIGNIGINQSANVGSVDVYAPQPSINKIVQNVSLTESISRWVNWLKA
jgi:nucleoside-diphosphate-sugar epimerase